MELQYFIGWFSKDLGGTEVVKYFKFDQNLNFIIRAKLTDLFYTVRLSLSVDLSVNKAGGEH